MTCHRVCNKSNTTVPHVEQELLTLTEHLGLSGVRVVRSLLFCVMVCRSLFVRLSFFCLSLCCLSFFCLSLCCLSFFCLSVCCPSFFCLSVCCPSFFCLSLCCLSFFCLSLRCLSLDLRLMVTTLISSDFSRIWNNLQ